MKTAVSDGFCEDDIFLCSFLRRPHLCREDVQYLTSGPSVGSISYIRNRLKAAYEPQTNGLDSHVYFRGKISQRRNVDSTPCKIYKRRLFSLMMNFSFSIFPKVEIVAFVLILDILIFSHSIHF